MLLSIIIVSYNTKALTIQTLDSVVADVAKSPQLEDQTEVFVVDNNSTDDSVSAVVAFAKKHHFIRLLQNNDNLGFSAANNLAIKKARGKYILLLNSDTIIQPGTLDAMIAAFQADEQKPGDGLHRLGIVAAALYNPDDTIQAQGGSFPTLLSLASHMLLLDDLPVVGKLLPSTQHTGKNSRAPQQQTNTLQPIDWVGGTAMMIHKEVFAEVGLLDGSIFMYGEDVEFCLRAKAHHWQVAIAPFAKVTHFGSASSSSKNAIIGELKGYLYIWAKHKPLWQRPFAKTLIMVGVYLRRLLFGTMMKDTQRAAIYREAAHVLHAL